MGFPTTLCATRTCTPFSITARTQITFSSILQWVFPNSTLNFRQMVKVWQLEIGTQPVLHIALWITKPKRLPVVVRVPILGFFANGKSVAVNDVRYRFPYFMEDTDATKGKDELAKAYTNCDKDNLCVFITIPEPMGTKTMNVNYKFKTMIRTLKGTEDYKPGGYEVSWGREQSNRNNQPTSLVTVEQVGDKRKWHKLIDGTPVIAYDHNQELKDCSRRGLCDFETGKCKCFDGYSGYKCQERSVLGY